LALMTCTAPLVAVRFIDVAEKINPVFPDPINAQVLFGFTDIDQISLTMPIAPTR